jgi:O-antigen ligase
MLMLCLLPVEFLMFPLNLKVVDFALVLLTSYGLVTAWLTRQRLGFPLLVPMWLCLLASLIATLTGFALLDSVLAIVQEVYLFVWFLALTNILSTFSLVDLDLLMKTWSVVAAAEAAATLMGMLRIGPHLFYTSSFDQRVLSHGSLTRSIGTFVNPNATAAYLSISLFVLLATSWPIWLRSVLGIWVFAGMFATGSMAALAATLGSLVILLLLFWAEDRWSTALQGGVLGVGVGLLSAVVSILSLEGLSLSGLSSRGNSTLYDLTVGRFWRSLKSRLVLVEKAQAMYRRYPWGTGPNSSGSYIATLHNDYVAFLFERGPLGALAWVWMVGATLWAPLRAAFQCPDRSRRWRLLALGAGFLACAVNALAHEISHFRQVWVLMAFVFATVHVTSAREDRS